jgi:hypothetical protein
MSRLEIILSCVLAISTVFNIGLFFYTRAVVTRLLSLSEELGDLQYMIDSFAKHTKAVYELDMFYGDQTLQYLMEHAVSLNEQLENFEHIYSLIEKDEEGTVEDTEEEEDAEEEIP